jgi:hypothetical protein
VSKCSPGSVVDNYRRLISHFEKIYQISNEKECALQIATSAANTKAQGTPSSNQISITNAPALTRNIFEWSKNGASMQNETDGRGRPNSDAFLSLVQMLYQLT